MHAREVMLALKWAAEGKLDVPILGEQKIRSTAEAFGIPQKRRQLKNVAKDLADALLEDLSRTVPASIRPFPPVPFRRDRRSGRNWISSQ
jgi:carbon-monoxide dehydrogenase catalytic subunit